MPAAGACFAVARFNLPAINPPCPCLRGIFVVFLVGDAEIVPFTSSDKTPHRPHVYRLWGIECTGYVSPQDAGTHFNSLPAMDAHERPLFIELRGTVVSRRVFIRSQSLIAR